MSFRSEAEAGTTAAAHRRTSVPGRAEREIYDTRRGRSRRRGMWINKAGTTKKENEGKM